MIQWTLHVIQIKSLKDNPKNPRRISKGQLAHLENLIKTYGLIDRPVINKDLTIIGGHQRVKVLKRMKAKTVECWMPDHQLDQAEIDHLCIGLNLNQGEFDYDKLANEYDPLNLLSWGFTETQLLGACKEAEDITEALAKGEAEKDTLNTAPDNVTTITCPLCNHRFDSRDVLNQAG